jgi:DNA-binding transcriptional LysR family regulator
MRHLTTFRLIDKIAKTRSIRAAAEDLYLAPSAAQRRLQAFEEELGEPIFDRLSSGVRLNAAGELVIHHIRMQLAETERLHSRIADLAGMRRGHVSIACSQALAPSFLPQQIARYRERFPEVTFSVAILNHYEATRSLEEFSVDLAIVFDPIERPRFQLLNAVKQNLMAVVSRHHPLATEKTIRLHSCMHYPLVLPTSDFGGRQILERAVANLSISITPTVESNSFEFLKYYVLHENAITFQIPIGVPQNDEIDGLVTIPIDERDVTSGMIYVGQLSGRILPVASARFADEISRYLV